jgi:Replication-relaxation
MLENARSPNPQPVVLFTTPDTIFIPSQRREKRLMRTSVNRTTPLEKILVALAEFDYLTAAQVTRLLYAPSSLTHVREQLKSLVDNSLVLALSSRLATHPRVYTLTGKGRTYAALLGIESTKRVRPSEEHEKARNLFFIQHTLAVIDVLLGARLLSQTAPGITLTRLFPERALKRFIYVALPEPTKRGREKTQTICIEPDASCDFTIEETWHDKPQTWQDFFYIEVYRHLPMETRFKQKVQGYVVMALTGQHEELFQTSALSIAVFAATDQQARTLKRWTEEALQQLGHPAEGQRFFFSSIDPATASPAEVYLTPVWQQAFGEAPTPLLVLGEEGDDE